MAEQVGSPPPPQDSQHSDPIQNFAYMWLWIALRILQRSNTLAVTRIQKRVDTAPSVCADNDQTNDETLQPY